MGVITNRFDGVRRAAAADFLLVNFAPGLSSQGEPKEANAFRGRRGLPVRFERRLRRGNEEQPGEAQFLPSSLRYEQVPKMDRIKRTTE